MKPRVLVLPLAALVITALVAWRITREPPHVIDRQDDQPARRLAPRFALYDQHSQLVKFERYLGRNRVVVLFLGDTAPDDDPLLSRLRDGYAALQAAGLEVVAISLNTPHAVREAERRTAKVFPFPVLTDIDLQTPIPAPVHRLWGLTDDDTSAVRSGAFFVDRAGRVAWQDGSPQPLHDPSAFLDARMSEQE